MPFIDLLRKSRAQAQRTGDPWRRRLERARGKVGDDGVARISTQGLFDLLELPHRSRGRRCCQAPRKADARAGLEPHQGTRINAGRVP